MTVEWRERLRAQGYRITPQRELVYDAVVALQHATPEELLTQVQRTSSAVNLSTIYRTLEVLEAVGLVRHSHLGHGAPTYHAAEHADHLHLVCSGCGTVIEAPARTAETLTGTLARDFGFETDVEHFAIYGRCADCAVVATDGVGPPAPRSP